MSYTSGSQVVQATIPPPQPGWITAEEQDGQILYRWGAVGTTPGVHLTGTSTTQTAGSGLLTKSFRVAGTSSTQTSGSGSLSISEPLPNPQTLQVASVGTTDWTAYGAPDLVTALNGPGEAMSPDAPVNAVLPVTFAEPQDATISQVVEFRFDAFYRSGDGGMSAVFELGYDNNGTFVLTETVTEENLFVSPTNLYYSPTVQPPPGSILRARIIANAT